MLPFGDVSLLAVLVSSIASMGLGMLWFSPYLFGKRWMVLMKMTPEDMCGPEAAKSMMYGSVFLLVMAFAVGLVLAMFPPVSVPEGLLYGSVFWFAFTLPADSAPVIWEKGSLELALIKTFHNLVCILLIVAIQVAWPW